jgi:hypothetical protein
VNAGAVSVRVVLGAAVAPLVVVWTGVVAVGVLVLVVLVVRCVLVVLVEACGALDTVTVVVLVEPQPPSNPPTPKIIVTNSGKVRLI